MTGALLGLAMVVIGGTTDWSAIVLPAMKQVARIEILKDGEDKPGICSGVAINADAGFLLTAAHCVEGEPKQLSVTVNGRHAEIARTNRLLDLAVLRFKVKDEQTMLLAEKTPPIGTEVAIIGFNFGVEKLAVQFGRVSQMLNAETKTLWIDGTMVPGQSGGAVIDANGRLVGMTSRIYHSGPSRIGGAIPVESLEDFLEPYLPAKEKK
jgi:S1-C subfamily serine protease